MSMTYNTINYRSVITFFSPNYSIFFLLVAGVGLFFHHNIKVFRGLRKIILVI